MDEEFKRKNLDITFSKVSINRYQKFKQENKGKFGKFFTWPIKKKKEMQNYKNG